MRYIFILFVLFIPLFSSASVPTDYGSNAIQRTPYDFSGKYMNWCFTGLSASVNTVYPYSSSTLTDLNNLPYIKGSNTSPAYMNVARLAFSRARYCDTSSTSPSYRKAPATSWLPNVAQGGRWYIFHHDPTNLPVGSFYYDDTSTWKGVNGEDYNVVLSNSAYRSSLVASYGGNVGTSTTVGFTYNTVNYYITRLGGTASLATSTYSINNTWFPTNNTGIIDNQIYLDDADSGAPFANSSDRLYAVVYSTTDLIAQFASGLDVVTYLNNLNNQTTYVPDDSGYGTGSVNFDPNPFISFITPRSSVVPNDLTVTALINIGNSYSVRYEFDFFDTTDSVNPIHQSSGVYSNAPINFSSRLNLRPYIGHTGYFRLRLIDSNGSVVVSEETPSILISDYDSFGVDPNRTHWTSTPSTSPSFFSDISCSAPDGNWFTQSLVVAVCYLIVPSESSLEYISSAYDFRNYIPPFSWINSVRERIAFLSSTPSAFDITVPSNVPYMGGIVLLDSSTLSSSEPLNILRLAFTIGMYITLLMYFIRRIQSKIIF